MIKLKLSTWWSVCKDAVVAWSDDFAPSMGAAISYYTVFSLAPLLVLVIAVAGYFFGAEAVRGQISGQLGSLMGADTAKAVEAMVQSAAISDKSGWASALSVGILLVGATSVFAELQAALDRIWHVPESQKPSGIWGILRARVFSFGLILVLAFLLMVSLMVSAGLAAFGAFLGGILPGQELLLQLLNLIVALAVTTVLFAAIFKWMPTARVGWRDVWVGAAVTAVLFELGKFAIGIYLGKSGFSDSFAGAGALVILLAWVYYAAQIFLLGAEFTKVFAYRFGTVSRQAEPVAPDVPTKETVEQAAAQPGAAPEAGTALQPAGLRRQAPAAAGAGAVRWALAAFGVVLVLKLVRDSRTLPPAR
ncbi:MAG: YihY/virulence factor BrkB family protein [Comamonadaceae bacterium]|nr:MAG: YihY/virulence factor BrkB family protein [Comamonadaceae bacterium]